MEFLKFFWNFIKGIPYRLRRPMRSEPKPTPPPVEAQLEPTLPPVEAAPEPAPPPVESEPEPAPPPVEAAPEPTAPPVEAEPEPAPPSEEPEPKPTPPREGPEPESASPPEEPEPERASPPEEPEPEPAPLPEEPEPEPTLSPVKPEPTPVPAPPRPQRAPRIPQRSPDEGPRTPREPWRFGARRSYDGARGGGGEVDHPRPPELCCRQDELEWTIFLRVASDFGVTCVRLDGEELLAEDGEYRLPRFRGSISLSGEGAEAKNIPLFDRTRTARFPFAPFRRGIRWTPLPSDRKRGVRRDRAAVRIEERN